MLKAKYATEKTKRGLGAILPIFSREKVSDFVNEILREDEYIRQAVISNPQYRNHLENIAKENLRKYRGILIGGKLVDSWDRITSGIGLICDAAGVVSSGAGNLASALEEIPELIPKAIYARYYLGKTKDYRALPIWSSYEAASFIPGVGDLIDMTNSYINRARKFTKEAIKKDFRKSVKIGKLENVVLERAA